jgi:hypothetical protein
MSGTPTKKPKRELRGLLDQHSTNYYNNTVTQNDPIITPLSSNHLNNRLSRKRKLGQGLLDGVSCETVNRVLGSTVANPTSPSADTSEDIPKRNDSLPSATTSETYNIDDDKATNNDTENCPPVTKKDYSNVILPWQELLNFMTANFCCRTCQKPFSESNFEKVQVSFATSVNFFCPGCTVANLPADTRDEMGKNQRTNYADTDKVLPNRYAVHHLHDDYSLNQKVILALQQVGSGRAGGAVFGGLLSIFGDPMKSQWTEVETEIGKAEIMLGEEIIEANLEEEKSLSEKDKFGRSKLSVAIDAGWNNRGSGRSYNSDSGHHLMVGNRSKKVIAVHYMSKRCVKCETEEKNGQSTKQHEESVCSRNYRGSSKGMECHGLLKSTLDLFLEKNCVLEIVVMDDDSSSENILQWDYVEAMKTGQLTSIPKTKSGAKKANTGQLPLTHPQWQKLADHNHRLRCLAGMLYKLAKASLDKSLVTNADAERLKRNSCYAVHEYKTYDFETFKRMVWAVLYHHFGIHDTCGPWCPWLRNKDNPEELKKLYYRDKVADKALYDQILELWESYCSDENLRSIHHAWHTNKCESMNNFIAKFVRKSMHLCRSIVGKARTYLAVSLDSVGYEDYYRTLFGILGLHYDETICGTSHRRLDNRKKFERTYNKKPEVRRARCKTRSIKIRECMRKAILDKKKGYCYETGMNAPKPPKKEKKAKVEPNQCGWCFKFGHTRRAHRDCGKTTFVKKTGKYT